MKLSIKERLKLKSNKELRAIATRLNFPLGANDRKIDMAISLSSHLNSRRQWEEIANSGKT